MNCSKCGANAIKAMVVLMSKSPKIARDQAMRCPSGEIHSWFKNETIEKGEEYDV